MNLRQYILILLLGTIIAWTAWVIVLFNINPVNSGFFAFIIFYLTLFIGLNGIFTTISMLVRSALHKKRKTEEIVKISLRQGIMLALLVIGALIFLGFNLLTWWTILLLVIFIGLIEFFFLSTNNKSHANAS